MNRGTSSPCVCLGTDTLAAKQAIRKAPRVAELVDESHFMASIGRCDSCGRLFLTLFCERVDWADSDGPQHATRVSGERKEADAVASGGERRCG